VVINFRKMMIKCDLDCSRVVLAGLKISAVLIGLIATIIVFKLCTNHLRHYTNPYFQNKIIGDFPPPVPDF